MRPLAPLAAGIAALAACAAPPDAGPPETRLSRLALGTLVEIAVRESDPARARAALEAGFEEIERLEALLSGWRETSEVSALNRAAGHSWVTVSLETAQALEASRQLASNTDGAFDPTVAPLLRLWGFAGGTPRVPDAAEIAAARARVGWRALEVDLETRRARLTRADAALSLGGIGKGFIADAVLARLRERGIDAALVAAAGDLAFYGGTRGRPWTVAIEDPDHPGGLLAEMPLREGGVSTSAPTYRYFEAEGRRFHHLLDPRTGYPAAEVRSVTVVAPLATQSDGFSTAIFVLGRDGEALLARHPEVSALILFEDGTRFLSPELPVRWLRSTVDGG